MSPSKVNVVFSCLTCTNEEAAASEGILHALVKWRCTGCGSYVQPAIKLVRPVAE